MNGDGQMTCPHTQLPCRMGDCPDWNLGRCSSRVGEVGGDGFSGWITGVWKRMGRWIKGLSGGQDAKF